MKKPKLRCCLTWVIFIELIFTVPCLLKSKIWNDRFAGKGGGWGILRNGGDHSNWGIILKWGDLRHEKVMNLLIILSRIVFFYPKLLGNLISKKKTPHPAFSCS